MTTPETPFRNQTHDFTVKDRWGVEHQYMCTLHRYADGQALMHEIMGVFAGSSVPIVVSFLSSGTIDDEADLSGAGKEIQRWLSKKASVTLVRAVLSLTTRNGHRLNKLSHLNDAYTANYKEQFKAVWEVIQLNDFLPVLDSIKDAFASPEKEEEEKEEEEEEEEEEPTRTG